MQTLHAGCSKAEPKKFRPTADPFPGVQDGQNLISWRWSLPSPTDRVWSRLMQAISSYRGNRPTHKQTHKHTGPITIHYAAKLSAQCNQLMHHSVSVHLHTAYLCRPVNGITTTDIITALFFRFSQQAQ